MDFTAIVGWNNVEETRGDYVVEVRAWEHDDNGDDDLRTAGNAQVPAHNRVFLAFEWPFRFRQVLMPSQVRFVIGEPRGGAWNTEWGDEEVYLRVELKDRATNAVVDSTRTRTITGDW